jgi:hypothetical protein
MISFVETKLFTRLVQETSATTNIHGSSKR